MFNLNLTINSNASNFERGESTSSNEDNDSKGLTSTSTTLDLFPLSRLDELDRGQMELQPATAAVQAKKSRRGPRSRSSQYRGVTFYRRTGRWESHIWDCGKQVYLGGFDTALAAARAYDRAAIKFRGVEADINFNLSEYDDVKQMMNLSKEEFVQLLRRGSTGFTRGNSKYRGVTLYKSGLGKKANDKAAVVYNGSDVVANFEMTTYNGGSRHDLNLNLGMSASSVREGGCLDSSKLHRDAQTTKTMKIHDGSSASNAGCDPPLEGVPLTSQHSILRIGVDPKFVQNNEERERSGSISQLQMANLPGHFQTNTNMSTAFAAAASSGFSSPPPSGYSWMRPFFPPS